MSKQNQVVRYLLVCLFPLIGSLTGWAQTLPTAPHPGEMPAPSSSISSDQPGSILIYPYYSSGYKEGDIENTEIVITNTFHDTAKNISVHLFLVNGRDGMAADTYICLLGTQTARFQASDIDPGVGGYIIAVAVDANGWPISANYLTGRASLKLKSGHTASLPAQTISALFTGSMPGNKGETAKLQFDGKSYAKLPRTVSGDFVSTTEGNSHLLVISRIGGDLSNTVSPLGKLEGTVYDDATNAFSFKTEETTPQVARVMSDTFPQLVEMPLSKYIAEGRTGWLRFWGGEDVGLVGAIINFNEKAATSKTYFNGGRLLQQLTQTSAVSLIIPVIPSSCEEPPPAAKSDFALTQTASATTAAPGGEVTYTIKVTNNGPDEGSLMQSNFLTGAARFVSCTATGGVQCVAPGDTSRRVAYTLKKGQSETVTLVVKVDAAAANNSEVFLQSVALPLSIDDPNQNNNFAEAKLMVKTAPATFELSGRATMRNGLPLRDVLISFDSTGNSGGQVTRPPVKTDANGNWKQTGFEAGPIYRVTPTKSGCSFAPNTTVVNSTAGNLNFVCR